MSFGVGATACRKKHVPELMTHGAEISVPEVPICQILAPRVRARHISIYYISIKRVAWGPQLSKIPFNRPKTDIGRLVSEVSIQGIISPNYNSLSSLVQD